MSIDTLHVCMYNQPSSGGMAVYTQELLTAMVEVGPGRGIAPELVTSEDLAAEHWTSAYPIHPILPRLVPRREYSTALAWAWWRRIDYPRVQQTFLDWLAGRQDLNLIHVQLYPLAYAAGLVVMVLTMTVASYFPARRAARMAIVDALSHI